MNFPTVEIHLETKYNCWLPCWLFILHRQGLVICVGILQICGHTSLNHRLVYLVPCSYQVVFSVSCEWNSIVTIVVHM